MRPRNQSARDQLTTVLARRAAASASEIAAPLGISIPTLHRLLRELDRVARVRVIVSDLRRSWAAAIGLWLASYPLGFHPHSRHDGVTSVMRGFTQFELGTLILDSTSRPAVTRNRVGFRITAHWSPTSAPT